MRCGEHEKAYLAKKNSNLWEHSRDVHKGEKIEVGYNVDKTFKDDVLARHLNDKNEWVRPAGVAISINRM